MTRPYYLNGSESLAAMTKPVTEIGDSFIAKNFTSISKDFNVAKRFSGIPRHSNCCLYEIELDKGIPHIDMVLTTKYKHEKEILLPRNIVFTLIKIIPDALKHVPSHKGFTQIWPGINRAIPIYVLRASLLNDDQFAIDNGCYLHNIASIEVDKVNKIDKVDKKVDEKKNQDKKTKKLEPELSDKIQKIGKCPNGMRRNKKTGLCESTTKKASPIQKPKLPRCPKGTRRNKTTGNCE